MFDRDDCCGLQYTDTCTDMLALEVKTPGSQPVHASAVSVSCVRQLTLATVLSSTSIAQVASMIKELAASTHCTVL